MTYDVIICNTGMPVCYTSFSEARLVVALLLALFLWLSIASALQPDASQHEPVIRQHF